MMSVARIGGLELHHQSTGAGPPRASDAVRQLAGGRYHQAHLAAAPDPGTWPELVRKVLELDGQPQDWRPRRSPPASQQENSAGM